MSRPEATEAVPYYFTYINRVDSDDIAGFLKKQLDETALLREISEPQSLLRYEPSKWSIREVLGHIIDTERVFAFRALWFARGFDSPLPSFDQEVAAKASAAHSRPWAALVEDLRATRAATVAMFDGLADAAWHRDGVASGSRFTVRAIAYIIGGHLAHHVDIVKERYLAAR